MPTLPAQDILQSIIEPKPIYHFMENSNDLTASAQRLLGHLMLKGKRVNTCFSASVQGIARESGLSLASVKRGKKVLGKKGIIVYSPGVKGRPGVWKICLSKASSNNG